MRPSSIPPDYSDYLHADMARGGSGLPQPQFPQTLTRAPIGDPADIIAELKRKFAPPTACTYYVRRASSLNELACWSEVDEARDLVRRWLSLSNEGLRRRAIEEVYRLDEELESGAIARTSLVLAEATRLLAESAPSICLSLLTVTAPWHRRLRDVRRRLYDKTREALVAKHDEAYASKAMVGLSGE